MKPTSSCSLIVYTYNWPEALETTLISVFKQSIIPKEIVICDDGSGEATRRVVEKLSAMSPVPLLHVWHPEQGCSKAVVINKGVAASTGEYIIEIDQEVVLHKDFIRDHLLHRKRGRFLTSKRFCTRPDISEEARETKNFSNLFAISFSKESVRMKRIPFLQKLIACFYTSQNVYEYVSGSNMSFWRDDFLRLNGYDESFSDWGWEDTDLALRLMNGGIKLSVIRFAAIQFHLYHTETSRNHQVADYLKEMQTTRGNRTFIEKGIHQYLQKADILHESAPSKWHLSGNHVLMSA